LKLEGRKKIREKKKEIIIFIYYNKYIYFNIKKKQKYIKIKKRSYEG
tara:strand:- start:251 stop:391 length:141 start_codon:yes stop_codon:yes gene_type:complete